jgi:hypothetical protein
MPEFDLHEAVDGMTKDAADAYERYADLVLLTRHMADNNYSAVEIADAVEKPHKYAMELSDAKNT